MLHLLANLHLVEWGLGDSHIGDPNGSKGLTMPQHPQPPWSRDPKSSFGKGNVYLKAQSPLGFRLRLVKGFLSLTSTCSVMQSEPSHFDDTPRNATNGASERHLPPGR